MPKNKPRRLNEVVDAYAPQGANDRRWFFVEHQLIQAETSARSVVGSLKNIVARPENEGERQVANDCLDIMKPLLTEILGAKAVFLSYLSDTAVSERISKQEV